MAPQQTKTHATFTWAARETLGEGDAATPGAPIAAWLAGQLAAAGVAVTPLEDLGFAHGFRADVGRRRFYLTVGLVDDGPREWLLVIDPAPAPLAQLFGGERGEHAQLADAIHAALSAEPRAAELRWYDERAWDRAAETDWTAAP